VQVMIHRGHLKRECPRASCPSTILVSPHVNISGRKLGFLEIPALIEEFPTQPATLIVGR
jgi:hypothetical protein